MRKKPKTTKQNLKNENALGKNDTKGQKSSNFTLFLPQKDKNDTFYFTLTNQISLFFPQTNSNLKPQKNPLKNFQTPFNKF